MYCENFKRIESFEAELWIFKVDGTSVSVRWFQVKKFPWLNHSLEDSEIFRVCSWDVVLHAESWMIVLRWLVQELLILKWSSFKVNEEMSEQITVNLNFSWLN